MYNNVHIAWWKKEKKKQNLATQSGVKQYKQIQTGVSESPGTGGGASLALAYSQMYPKRIKVTASLH